MPIEGLSREVFLARPEQSSQWLLHTAKRAGKIAAWASLSLAGGAATVMNMPTEVAFGPHQTEVTATFDGTLTLDFGMLGSIRKPLDEPIGAHVDIGQLPEAEDEGTPTEIAQEYLEKYLRFFGDIKKDIEAGKEVTVEHFLNGTLLTAAISMALYTGIPRHKLKEVFDSFNSRAALALSAVVLAAFAPNTPPEPPEPIIASPVFDGTVLEGASVEGGALKLAVPAVLDFLEKNDEFYDKVRSNLEAAIADTHLPLDTEDTVTSLFFTDNHCNPGMDRTIGRAAELVRARRVYDGGDTSFSGSAFEAICIRTLTRYVPADKLTEAPGNHDSEMTEQQMRERGIAVLDGEPIEHDDMRVLGDRDPRRSELGRPIEQIGDETVEQLGQRMAQAACADEDGIDVMLLHDRNAVRPALQAGCASIGLAGHVHRRTLEFIQADDGRVLPLLTGDSAGGADSGLPTFGPLRVPAELYVIRYNTATNTALSLRIIRIMPDASVAIEGPIYLINQQPTVDS